jgi:uncharacterized protein
MDTRTVSQLFIYPVKSLGGISLQQSKVLAKGLAYDRRWMLIDEQGNFLTQRKLPVMALFKTSFSDDGQHIQVQFENEQLLIPFTISGNTFKAQVWDDEVDVVEVNQSISAWFSRYMGFTCRLVAFPEDKPRPVDPDYAIDTKSQTSLSDGYPLLIIGQASLDDLNGRLAERVGMERFRPNIVFDGGAPYEEEGWKRFRIGSLEMAGVKPCARCVMTTIDQQTGTVGKEPLAALSVYRRVGNKVLFGQNVIPLNEGMIRVGDEILLR